MQASSASGLTAGTPARPIRIRIAERVGALEGWRRALLAVVLGAAAAAALPPLGIVPAVFIAMTGMIWQIDGTRSWRGALWVGWLFGLGHFAAGTYWISNALLVEADRFWWLVPFAFAGISAYLALFPAIASALARLVRAGPLRILGLAAAWTAMEMVRGVLMTGFPWNPIGSVWVEIPAMIQSAAIVGVFGLSFVTVLLAAAPALIACRGRAAVLAVAGLPFALAVLWGGGALRLSAAQNGVVPDVRLAIVQPDIPQTEKVQSALRLRHFVRHLRLTRQAVASGVTHVIWPESAVGFPLDRAPDALREIGAVAPPGGEVIVGAIRATPVGERPLKIWNSLQVIDDHAKILATYDKSHLVPFGEYVPLRSILGFAKVTAGRLDFSEGDGPRTLAPGGVPPFSPLICYEIIFPGAVTGAGGRPAWLLNLTNDGWFGTSSGPYQHFASARFRAVEEGLPVVRAANSGISGVIDPYGRVVASLGLGRAGVLKADLPKALAEPTPFARWGNGPVIAAVIAIALGLAWAGRSRKPPARQNQSQDELSHAKRAE